MRSELWNIVQSPKCDAKEEDPRDEESGELRSQVLHVVRVHRIHQKGTVDTLRLRSCILHSSTNLSLLVDSFLQKLC